MDIVQVGYYQGREKARVPISRGAIKAVYGSRPQRLRAEYLEDTIVLTDIREPAYLNREE
jgi:hypothetical protein